MIIIKTFAQRYNDANTQRYEATYTTNPTTYLLKRQAAAARCSSQ